MLYSIDRRYPLNRTRAKILYTAARLMSREDSTLRRSGDGSLRYPPRSTRAIYQRLKRSPHLWTYCTFIVKLHKAGLTAKRAAEALRAMLDPMKAVQERSLDLLRRRP